MFFITAYDNMSVMNLEKNAIIIHSILKHLKSKGPGYIFTPKDLSKLGSQQVINVSLFRLREREVIKKISHGLYYYPEQSEMFGELPPDMEKVIEAIAKKYRIKIQPSGAYAANLLGLSEQVPKKLIFLTEGESKKILIGNREIILKKTTPKNMKMAGKISGLVVQAIKHIGKEHIDDTKIEIIRNKLSDMDKRTLNKEAILAPSWIRSLLLDKILKGFHG